MEPLLRHWTCARQNASASAHRKTGRSNPGCGCHPDIPASTVHCAPSYYHGGPHNSVALGFNDQLHVLAGAGFAVVGVNFRGSTGFGAAFADAILGDWGPRELADGLAIID